MAGPAIGRAGRAGWPGEPGSRSTAAQAEARSRLGRAPAVRRLPGQLPALGLAGAAETFLLPGSPATPPPRDPDPGSAPAPLGWQRPAAPQASRGKS